ncbi:hypothetical protein AHAS_Ahas04G0262700 [Arachis hypogaea]
MEKKLKSINDLLLLELIREIFLRIPIKHLVCLRRVWKLWNTLISEIHYLDYFFINNRFIIVIIF